LAALNAEPIFASFVAASITASGTAITNGITPPTNTATNQSSPNQSVGADRTLSGDAGQRVGLHQGGCVEAGFTPAEVKATGHAGAMLSRSSGIAAAKKTALEAAGGQRRQDPVGPGATEAREILKSL
jgi:hypothetical protein